MTKVVDRHYPGMVRPYAGPTAKLSTRYGAQQEANGGPGLGFEVLTLLHALTNEEGVGEDHDRPQDQLGSLARVHGLELFGLDTVAQDQFRHVAHDVLVR